MSTALITGAARRIGQALALRFAEAGYDIALHYYHSEQDAHETIRRIEAKGRRCRSYCYDLGAPSAPQALMDAVFGDMPDCRVLVNNASIFERFSFRDTDEAVFDRHMDINFKAPFFSR